MWVLQASAFTFLCGEELNELAKVQSVISNGRMLSNSYVRKDLRGGGVWGCSDLSASPNQIFLLNLNVLYNENLLMRHYIMSLYLSWLQLNKGNTTVYNAIKVSEFSRTRHRGKGRKKALFYTKWSGRIFFQSIRGSKNQQAITEARQRGKLWWWMLESLCGNLTSVHSVQPHPIHIYK